MICILSLAALGVLTRIVIVIIFNHDQCLIVIFAVFQGNEIVSSERADMTSYNQQGLT